MESAGDALQTEGLADGAEGTTQRFLEAILVFLIEGEVEHPQVVGEISRCPAAEKDGRHLRSLEHPADRHVAGADAVSLGHRGQTRQQLLEELPAAEFVEDQLVLGERAVDTRLDLENFTARGLVIDGMERGVGVSIFTILLVGLVAGLEASGVLGRLIESTGGRARTARGAELWVFATVSLAVLLTTHSVVALLAVGRFTREAGERFGLSPYRRANLLDTTVCTYPFILPYCIPTVLAASTTAAGEAVGLPRLSPLTIGLVNFHSWALLAVVLFAILTGYGRSGDEQKPPS